LLAAAWQANFKSWNDALQTKDPAAVASMYSARHLSFLPTVSPAHIRDIEGTENYFTAFVAKDPFGTVTDESVQVYENGSAYLHSGMYTFDLGQGSDRAPVEARFSYMWRLEDGAWKITHHHSSARPKAPDGSQAASVSGGQPVVSMYSAGSQPQTPAGLDVARVSHVGGVRPRLSLWDALRAHCQYPAHSHVLPVVTVADADADLLRVAGQLQVVE
jgi:uncharacterized protein (TIGR02246 family)